MVERENQRFATMGIVVQQALATTRFGATKKAFDIFNKLIKTLSGA